MKNSLFNLPDFGGELLDFRLALRLVVRQAIKPVLGHLHSAPRHTVASPLRMSFVPALKGLLRNNLRYVARSAFRLQALLPAVAISKAGETVTSHPVSAGPAEKLRDGMWVECNKHAVVIARGAYVNNKKNAVWREYYDTGELMIEENYLMGNLHGRFSTFHPNGQCCSSGRYEHGRREGRFFMYDEGGQHVRTLTFKRDVLVNDVVVEGMLAMA